MVYGNIYKIENIANGKVYIGQTVNVSKRFKEHKNDLRNNNHHNVYLQRAWNKYGENSFVFEIIDEADEKCALDALECFWIGAYGGYQSKAVYNAKDGGANGIPTKETKRKISTTLTGHKASKETREKQSIVHSGENHWNFGNTTPEITKQRIRESMPDMSGENSPTWGKKLTQEQKDYIGACNSGANSPLSKAVYCVELHMYFDSIGEAQLYFTGKRQGGGHLSKVCDGEYATAHGYHWLWASDVSEDNIAKCLKRERYNNRYKHTIAVKCVELNIVFDSLKDAAKWCGLKSQSALTRACKTHCKTKGFHWEYV